MPRLSTNFQKWLDDIDAVDIVMWSKSTTSRHPGQLSNKLKTAKIGGFLTIGDLILVEDFNLVQPSSCPGNYAITRGAEPNPNPRAKTKTLANYWRSPYTGLCVWPTRPAARADYLLAAMTEWQTRHNLRITSLYSNAHNFLQREERLAKAANVVIEDSSRDETFPLRSTIQKLRFPDYGEEYRERLEEELAKYWRGVPEKNIGTHLVANCERLSLYEPPGVRGDVWRPEQVVDSYLRGYPKVSAFADKGLVRWSAETGPQALRV